MRLRVVVPIALLIAVLAGCHRPPATRTDLDETHAFAAAPGKLVRLDLRSLDADVTVVEGESIGVETHLEAHSSSRAAARRWVERNTPVIEDSPSRLEISVPKHGGISVIGFISTKGVVHVKLPAQCTLEVHTASGDVTIQGGTVLSAPVRVETASGDVTVHGGAKELLLDTASGDVRVTGDALAVLQADTASGDVRVDSGAARAAVETASGDIRLRNLGGDLTANTSSGTVEARWSRLPAGSKVRIGSSSGDVTLRLPATAALSGEVRTTSGDIRSDFPGAEESHGHRFTLSGAAVTPERPEAAAAGAELSIRTSSGDVTLVKATIEL
jgi:DUF4097 and DUF4098 domain-containing protein YvlB